MADEPPRTPDRPIRAQTPGAPKAPQKTSRRTAAGSAPYSSSASPKPQQASLSSLDFGPPLPSIHTPFPTSRDQEGFTSFFDGFHGTMPQEHNNESVFSSPQELFMKEDDFRALLESTNEESAGNAQQAFQPDGVALIDYADHDNTQDPPPVPRLPQAESPNIQNRNWLEPLPAFLDGSTGMEQGLQNQKGMTDEMRGSQFSVFRADRHTVEPVHPYPNVRQIKYVGPARVAQCTSSTCPVREAHGVGLYVHNSKWGLWPTLTFGISNPPPHIWAAEARRLAKDESPEDMEMIHQFIMHHDRPYPGAQRCLSDGRK